MIEERKLAFHSYLFKDATRFTGLLVKKKNNSYNIYSEHFH